MEACTVILPDVQIPHTDQQQHADSLVEQFREQLASAQHMQSCKLNQIEKAKLRLQQLKGGEQVQPVVVGNVDAFNRAPERKQLPLDKLRSLLFWEKMTSWTLENKMWAFVRWHIWMEAGWHVNEAEEAREMLLLASGSTRRVPRKKTPSSVRRKERALFDDSELLNDDTISSPV